MTARENDKRDRRDWLIILLILLFGFLCILLAGGWALRFAPSWRLDTSMGSRLDPNSDFLTSQPVGFFDPLDPAILTKPSWIDVFLTPGASFETGTPVPTSINVTPIPSTPTTKPPVTASPTNTLAVSPSPTRTSIVFPPTRTPTPGPAISADLRITKTDGSATYIAGSPVTYTIVVSNNGPNNVTGARVSDPKPSQVTTWQWACTSQNNGASGCSTLSGNANFNDTVFLPVGGSITYTVTANIAVNATGNLVNTASVNVPPGYTDPNTANNSATDTDTFPADLQITKTSIAPSYIANGTVTYTVIVTNNGPNSVTGALVSDTKPAQITNWSWACTAQTGGATGCDQALNIGTNFTDTVNLPNGASIRYTVTANISSTATGNLSNTATVNVPAGYTDPNAGNNFDIETDIYALSADLAITKTDGSATYPVGGNVTYTITVSNPSGPDNVINATVTDTFSTNTNIASATWTCSGAGGGTCAVIGSGDISDTVDLPVGASVTYTVNATISSAATGSLDNTATVTSSIADPVLANNTATDTDTPVFTVDLAITKTDGVGTYTPGTSVTYTIVVSNAGPADAINATVADTFPASVNATWTCVATGGANCTANGSGNINDTVDIPVGDTVTYSVAASIASSATGLLSNTATVTATGDTNAGNNSATDTDTSAPSADLSITKTNNSTAYAPSATKTYIIVVSNAGPSDAIGATVNDPIPTQVDSWDWECFIVTNASGCNPVTGSTSNFTDTVNIQSGGSITYRVTATISASPTGNLENTASIIEPVGTTDPVPGNNSASDPGPGPGDELIQSIPFPGGSTGQIGDTQDFSTDTIPPGNSVTFAFGTPLNVGSHPSWDLVYYELPITNPPNPVNGIMMDDVIIQISDGSNWFTILTWGDGFPNPNTNIASPIATPPNPTDCSGEPDNCPIDGTLLFNTTGITIDLDVLVPDGTYYYIRIISPNGDDGDGVEVDAIVILP